ncbi:MAG: hypothetical protein V1487_04085 [bacterium]
MNRENCPFCIPTSHDWLTKWGVSADKANAPILSTERLKVIPDLMPVSDEFHVLITSFDHRHAFASSPELDTELSLIISILEVRTGRPLIIAEHGGVEELGVTSKVQSIHHRHLHILPATVPATQIIADALDKERIKYTLGTAESPSPLANRSLIEVSKGGNGYLYLHDHHRNTSLLAPDRRNKFPSQITQRHLAIAYLGKFHNWKELLESPQSQQIAAQRIISTIERCQEK